MGRLTKIKIQNYRSIKNSGEIPITKLFALIGRNNTGKSSFLKAIQVLFGAIKEINATDFHKGTSDPISIKGVIKKWEKGEEKELKIEVSCKKGAKPKYNINGEDKEHANFVKSIPSLLIINDRRDETEFSTAGNRSTLLKKILSERKNVDGNELKSISEKLEKAKRSEAEEVSKILTEKFCEIAQERMFEVKIEPEVDVEKSTTHKSALIDKDIPDAPTVGITESGTGIQSLYLLTLLDVYGDVSKKSEDGILIIEEPEVYLHPDYQRRMFDAMRKIAEDNQVIFSTHSPIMISEIWLTESVRQVLLRKGETNIEEVKVEDVISELGIRYEDVLNPKLTIFVEGNDDIEFYKKLGLKPNEKVVFITTDGFRSMHYFAYIKIISSENVESIFVSIADGDGENPKIRLEEFQKEVKGQFKEPSKKMLSRINNPESTYILEKYSIESYFLTIETMMAAFPKIKKSDLEYLLNHYHSLYQKKALAIKNEDNLYNFQLYARPKLLFGKTERKSDSNPNFEKAYYAFWDDDAEFKRIREQLTSECIKVGGDWFNNMLSVTDLEKFDELTSMRKKILSLLK